MTTPTPEQVANCLLRDHLTFRQKWNLTRHGHFDIEAGGYTFRISNRRGENVWVGLWTNGRLAHRFCVYVMDPRGIHTNQPRSDIALTLKAHIESDPVRFMRTAG